MRHRPSLLLFGFAAALTSFGVASCVLPDDFVKAGAPAAGGAGGGGAGPGSGGGGEGAAGGASGGAGPSCEPFTGLVPDDCAPELLDAAEDCCVPGRSCGGAACQSGFCGPDVLGSSSGEALDVVVVGDRAVWSTGYGATLLSTPLGGGPPTILYEGSTFVTTIATDGERVFFTRYANGQVWSVDPDVGPLSALLVSDNGDHESWFGRIAVDDTNVYWASEDDDGHTPALWFAPKTGGSPLAITVGDHPYGVAADATHVYWTDLATARVLRCSKLALESCPDVQIMSDALSYPTEIAVRDGWVYWLDDDRLAAVPTGGGSTVTLGSASGVGMGLVLDTDYAYWTAQAAGVVYRTPLDGNGPTLPVGQADEPFGVAVSCDRVLVTTRPVAPPAELVTFPK